MPTLTGLRLNVNRRIYKYVGPNGPVLNL